MKISSFCDLSAPVSLRLGRLIILSAGVMLTWSPVSGIDIDAPGYIGEPAGLSEAGDLSGADGGGESDGRDAAIVFGEGSGETQAEQSIEGGDGSDGEAGVDGGTSTDGQRGDPSTSGGGGLILDGGREINMEILHRGLISGGDGGAGGDGGNGGNGGAGDDFSFNSGGDGADGRNGGSGGSGVTGSGFFLTNDGFITGGMGGQGGNGGKGGNGGSGTSDSQVNGGNGGSAGRGGTGGTGVEGGGFDLLNRSIILGGDGGAGGRGGDGGHGGSATFDSEASGGDAASGSGDELERIEGPFLFFGNQNGGEGGIGVESFGSDITNEGIISGGRGGDAGNPGTGGFAGAIVTGVNEPGEAGGGLSGGGGGIGIFGEDLFIENAGSIFGGDGGDGSNLELGGRGGTAVFAADTILINRGTISGGEGVNGRAAAVRFFGGDNILAIVEGSEINGNVIGDGDDRLIFAGFEGEDNLSFDAAKIAGSYEIAPDDEEFGRPLRIEEGPSPLTIDGPPELFHEDSQYFGFETVEIYTTGVVTFTGEARYNQDTIVNEGTLNVAGDLSSTSVYVEELGILKGIGSTGDLTLRNGARHAPGNSIGTQTVNGNYGIYSSTLEIEVTPGVASDRVVVNGEVEIDDGRLEILGVNETGGRQSASHVIILNDGDDAVVGEFTEVDNRLAFYDVETEYSGGDGNDVELHLTRNAVAPEQVASQGMQGQQAQQQRGVAGLVFSNNSADGHRIRNAILGITAGEAQDAFEQLSGDVYSAGSNTHNIVRSGLNAPIANRMQGGGSSGGSLASLFTGQEVQVGAFVADEPANAGTGSEVWVEGVGGRGTIDGGVGIAESDYDYRGIVAGYEFPTADSLVLGLYFSFADVDFVQTDRAASIRSENYGVGFYGGYGFGDDWRLSMQLGASWNQNNAQRRLAFGAINRVAEADYEDFYLNGSVEIAKTYSTGKSGYVEPFVGVTGRRENEGAFVETGAGAANLFRNSDTEYAGETLVGLRFGRDIETDTPWLIQPRAQVGWQHHLGSTENTYDTNFVGLPANGAVPVNGTHSAEDAFIGTVGVNLLSEGGASLYADYGFGVSSVHREHSIRGGVSLPW